MKKIMLFLLLAIVVFSTGCPKYRPKFNLDDRMINVIKTKYSVETARYDCLAGGYYYLGADAQGIHHCSDGNLGDAFQANPNGKADAKRIRDNIIDTTVGGIDDLYEDFTIDLQSRRSTTNILGDITELGLGTALGITKGERPLQILGVILTAFQGGRKSVDLNFYYQQTTPILISKMNALRDPILASIEQKKDLSVDAYALGTAERDLVNYFYAGSLVSAFTALADDTGVEAKQAKADLLRVQNRQITPNVSIDLANVQASITTELIKIEQDVRSVDPTISARGTARLDLIYQSLKQNEKFNPVFEILRAGVRCQQGVNQRQTLVDLETGNAVTVRNKYFLIRGVNCAIENDLATTQIFEKLLKK